MHTPGDRNEKTNERVSETRANRIRLKKEMRSVIKDTVTSHWMADCGQPLRLTFNKKAPEQTMLLE